MAQAFALTQRRKARAAGGMGAASVAVLAGGGMCGTTSVVKLGKKKRSQRGLVRRVRMMYRRWLEKWFRRGSLA
jgi:hypothetical protein